MIALQQCVPNALAEALRRQPFSAGKLNFAWRLAVGQAMQRATSLRLGPRPGEVIVTVIDLHWKREVERALPLVRNRLEYLLGTDVVSHIEVTVHTERSATER